MGNAKVGPQVPHDRLQDVPALSRVPVQLDFLLWSRYIDVLLRAGPVETGKACHDLLQVCEQRLKVSQCEVKLRWAQRGLLSCNLWCRYEGWTHLRPLLGLERLQFDPG